jgi:hypothetical protein
LRRLRLPSRVLVIALTALFAVFSGTTHAATGGNSQNAKKCQKGGWSTYVGSDLRTTFKSQGDCVSNAAQGGLLVEIPTLASQPLCESFGGTFGPGPDLIGALSNPVLWVCNGIAIPSTADYPAFVSNEALPLAYDCLADDGASLYWTAEFIGSNPGVANLTCYGPS